MPQTTTTQVKGTPSITTEQLKGTVVQVEGNDLLVRMSTGELRHFNVAPGRKFMIDGKELSLQELKPGTSLTATTTTTTTPVTTRTTTVGSGKVWFASGNTVILTLPNGENKMYKVEDSYRFTVNGQPASVHDLTKGMIVAAEKIVEEPSTEIASGTMVIGQAPPTPARATTTPAAPAQPRQMAAVTPAQTSTPAPAAASTPQQPAQTPAALPATGSPVSFIGLLGLLLVGASLGLRTLRRS
jgi:hypothetical protein